MAQIDDHDARWDLLRHAGDLEHPMRREADKVFLAKEAQAEPPGMALLVAAAGEDVDATQ
jgi:hypothetical protein